MSEKEIAWKRYTQNYVNTNSIFGVIQEPSPKAFYEGWDSALKSLSDGKTGACISCEVVGELNIKLEQENARLREALSFYAENKNWEQRDIGSRVIAAIDPVDHWEYVDKWGDSFWIGGKRANEALEKSE